MDGPSLNMYNIEIESKFGTYSILIKPIVEKISSDYYDVIIVDSINNSASGEQLQKTAGEKTMANRANVLSSQLPILIGLANQYNTTLIILSQVRDNMDKANKYSPDTVVPGGRSLHHNSSLTLELFKSSKKEKDEKGMQGQVLAKDQSKRTL